jgi:hypothetical protein
MMIKTQYPPIHTICVGRKYRGAVRASGSVARESLPDRLVFTSLRHQAVIRAPVTFTCMTQFTSRTMLTVAKASTSDDNSKTQQYKARLL